MTQDTLARHIRRRVLTAWHDVYMHRVMKRFQVARAQGLFREHVEQRVLLIWRRYVKTQLLKVARMSAADRFNRWSSMHMQVLPSNKQYVSTHSLNVFIVIFFHVSKTSSHFHSAPSFLVYYDEMSTLDLVNLLWRCACFCIICLYPKQCEALTGSLSCAMALPAGKQPPEGRWQRLLHMLPACDAGQSG